MTVARRSSEGIRFDSDCMGYIQPWTIEWRRLEYAGEVLVVGDLRAGDLAPLPDDVSFRIIFSNKGLKPRDRPGDSRTVLAVPRFRYDPVADTDRTMGPRTVSAPTRPGAAELQQILADQRRIDAANLRDRIVEGYANGRLYAYPGVELSPSDVFQSDSTESCVTAVASRLLSLAYLDRLFDETEFPGALDGDALAKLHAGLFRADVDAADAVLGYGPGLGLVTADGEASDDLACAAHDIITVEVESHQGAAPARDIVDRLVCEHGLSRSLAMFYLLSFVRQFRAEILLVDAHAVLTPSGDPFVGDRITWDLVGEIAFAETLLDQLGELRLNPAPAWGAALPYASALFNALEPEHFDPSRERDETLLVESLGALRDEVARTVDALEALSEAFPDDVHSHGVEGFDRLVHSVNHTEFLASARDVFGHPTALTEALNSLTVARRLADVVDQITDAKTYMEQMTFGRRHSGLALEHDTLAAQLHPSNLRANPALWGSIEENVNRLKGRYARTYTSHHRSYHQQARSLAKELEGRAQRVEALALLTEIPGLGPPVGANVQTAHRNLLAALRECDSLEASVLDSAPYCGGCLLPLSEDIPSENAENLFDGMDSAMRQYNRRLGTRAIQLVLANQSREQLEQFIRLLQVADPSSLENALDADVVAFLRRFMN